MEWHVPTTDSAINNQYFIYADAPTGRYKVCKAWVPSRGWVYTAWTPRPTDERGRQGMAQQIHVCLDSREARTAAEQHAGLTILLRCLCPPKPPGKHATDAA